MKKRLQPNFVSCFKNMMRGKINLPQIDSATVRPDSYIICLTFGHLEKCKYAK